MIVKGGTADITTYFAMRLAATGADATGLTIADFDMQYVRSGAAPVAKVDATALALTNTAHTDNYGIEIDATDQPGLYRFDWPDAAFLVGVREVILSIKHTSCLTEHLRVEIDPFGAPAGASLAADIAALPTANANADALLDRSNAIETGVTPRGLWRIIGAVLAGKVSGGQTGTETFRNMEADSKNRVVSTNQVDGDRTTVTLDMT